MIPWRSGSAHPVNRISPRQSPRVTLLIPNGGTVTVATVGTENDKVCLRNSLAVGAKASAQIEGVEKADAAVTASLLAAGIKKIEADAGKTFDLILCGRESTDYIGGEVGRAVGEKMRRVAESHQVVAITHLPQSAVCADRHFVVSKAVSGGRTRTAIAEVAGDDRVSEIARMLGGEKLTSVTRKHAEEMLENAKKKKD